MKICSIEGCGKKRDSYGLCSGHAHSLRRHGDPLAAKKRNGQSWIENGYLVSTKGREHCLAAERALGRPLPNGAVVHHVDENPLNNATDNLVICPSPGYHKILHMRTDALNACGNANWRWCTFCKTYDDPANMRDERVRFVHAKCSADSKRTHRQSKLSEARA